MGILIKGKCPKCGGELILHQGSFEKMEEDEIRCLKCGTIVKTEGENGK